MSNLVKSYSDLARRREALHLGEETLAFRSRSSAPTIATR